MGLREVKKEFSKLSKEDLLSIITDLYKKFNPVKDYLDLKVDLDEDEFVKRICNKIDKCFYPNQHTLLNYNKVKNILIETSKLNLSHKTLGEIYLFYIENLIEVIATYDYTENKILNSFINYFSQSNNCFLLYDKMSQYKERFEDIIEKSQNVGYGISDTLINIYEE